MGRTSAGGASSCADSSRDASSCAASSCAEVSSCAACGASSCGSSSCAACGASSCGPSSCAACGASSCGPSSCGALTSTASACGGSSSDASPASSCDASFSFSNALSYISSMGLRSSAGWITGPRKGTAAQHPNAQKTHDRQGDRGNTHRVPKPSSLRTASSSPKRTSNTYAVHTECSHRCAKTPLQTRGH